MYSTTKCQLEVAEPAGGDLTEGEKETLRALENKVDAGLKTFYEVGNALAEIRDRRLYRESHGTFEDYLGGRWGMSRPRAYQLIAAAEVVDDLSTIVDSSPPANEAQARELARLPEDQRANYWAGYSAECAEAGGKPTAAGVREKVDAWLKVPHVGNNSGENEWYTPSPYIEAAMEVMGGIDLDPASSVIANKEIKAKRFYTAEQNGLTKKWKGNVWLNPPYAQPLIGGFAEKLAASVESGNVTQACVLVNNATETKWFQRLASVASAVCFPAGRVKFWHPERESAPLQGQAVFYFGSRPDHFALTFGAFGLVVLPWRTAA